MDGDLKRTIQFLLERKVAVAVLDQQDLNLIRSREENAKAILKQQEKEKEKASSSGKEKAKATRQVASNNDGISKAALAQRARRQRERDAKRQLAQRTRKERETSGECVQPTQPRFFPALVPSRRRRAIKERLRMKSIKVNAIQSMSPSTEKTENAPQQTVVTKSLVSSSTTAILSQQPNLVHNSINGRSLPLVKNMLSTQPKQSNQVELHSLPPPRNLGLEPGRRIVQQGLHFKALGGPSSSAPCNFSVSNNGGNKQVINPGQRYKLELGRGRFQDNTGKYANCPQLGQSPLKPEVCLKQTPMRPKYVHFVPGATTNYRAPVMTYPQVGPSVRYSLGKPGIALHTVQSDFHKATAEAPHSVGSKGSDDKQRILPHGEPSVPDSLGEPDINLPSVQSDCQKATAEAPHSIGSQGSDDEQRTLPHGGPSVNNSLGKLGIASHAVQSDCHKATAEAPLSIGSMGSHDKYQRTLPSGGPSVRDSLGKPGIALHAVQSDCDNCDSLGKPGIALHAIQSDCHKATAETPRSIGSKGSDDMQRTLPSGGQSVRNSLGKPGIALHAVQSDCHKAAAEARSVGSKGSDDKQWTLQQGGLSVCDSLGKPGISLHAVQSDCHMATEEAPQLIGSQGSDYKQRTERVFCLPNLLKQLDESDQRDYIERLLHLPPAELSQHALELEKRAVQLTIEEGKEMQRVKALNILGKSGLTT